MNPVEPKSVSVDFDQTLCDSAYPDVGPPKPGAREAMQALKDMGFFIIVSSCRSCGWYWDLYYGEEPFKPACERDVHKAMVKWLEDNRIPYDLVDDGTKGKVSAKYYLDDKAVRVEDNWPEVIEFIRQKENAQKS